MPLSEIVISCFTILSCDTVIFLTDVPSTENNSIRTGDLLFTKSIFKFALLGLGKQEMPFLNNDGCFTPDCDPIFAIKTSLDPRDSNWNGPNVDVSLKYPAR